MKSGLGIAARVLPVVVLLCSAAAVFGATPDLLMWFDAPAKQFTQSLPLGNGRLGAMIFGGVDEERVVLNEGSLWSGSRQDADRPDAAQYLPEIRRLLPEGKDVEAEKLIYAHFTCRGLCGRSDPALFFNSSGAAAPMSRSTCSRWGRSRHRTSGGTAAEISALARSSFR